MTTKLHVVETDKPADTAAQPQQAPGQAQESAGPPSPRYIHSAVGVAISRLEHAEMKLDQLWETMYDRFGNDGAFFELDELVTDAVNAIVAAKDSDLARVDKLLDTYHRVIGRQD